MTRPKKKHLVLQSRLCELLRPHTVDKGWLCIEMAFCPLPEHELRAADVGFLWRERAEREEENISGSPDLIIEVLSPSNTVSEMYEREEPCLATGCAEFWVVDSERETVRVAKPGGSFAVYHRGDEVPLTLLGGRSLAVNSILPTAKQSRQTAIEAGLLYWN